MSDLTTDGGFVHEIFSGIQGEGLYVGERQIFVRLVGCNLSCRYCDTSISHEFPPVCRVEGIAAARDFFNLPNPLSMRDLSDILMRLCAQSSLHHSISITGGEPLVHPGLVARIATVAKEIGLKVFLETNGTLPDALNQVLSLVDIISMDIKLPSAIGADLFSAHERFLRLANERSVYTKIVVTGETQNWEIQHAVEVIGGVDPSIPLILQPVTPTSGVSAAGPEDILRWQAFCKERLQAVRVIPQCHKLMGQM